jgi:hypothetical protein
MNPNVTLLAEDENGTPVPYHPQPTASQKYLWGIYTKAIEYIRAYAKGDPITIFHLGDPAHGDKYPVELVTTAAGDQIEIAVANWQPLLSLPNVVKVRMATSTEAHSFGEHSTDYLIYNRLKAMYPAIDFRVVHHGIMSIDGYEIDYAHHGPGPGARVWLTGNVARYYLISLMMGHILRGTRPPDLVLRGHTHSPVDEIVTRGQYRSRIVTVPALCMPGAHAIQVTQSLDCATVGMHYFSVAGGRLVDDRELYQTLDLRTHDN